ncbi:toprim domain-containing protein [Porcipelethomonas sp.]|uniref:toprim domain-containing protein n=1 Tax=Porcipelethomonas sp. TaxID=2981675 RepID=UPI003EF7B212
MIKIDQAIIVEGKYDKIKISSIVDAVIIVTNGFGIFKDTEKLELIKYYAVKTGIIILTDSDSAGFKIRNHIKGAVKNGKIYNVYIPDIIGKEKRKTKPSAEGKLGVEGVEKRIILKAFENAGITASESADDGREKISKTDLYMLGLSGGKNSSVLRRRLLEYLNLPTLLSSNSMLEVLNTMMDCDELKEIMDKKIISRR